MKIKIISIGNVITKLDIDEGDFEVALQTKDSEWIDFNHIILLKRNIVAIYVKQRIKK